MWEDWKLGALRRRGPIQVRGILGLHGLVKIKNGDGFPERDYQSPTQNHELTYSSASYGGREAALQEKAAAEAQRIGADGKEMAEDAKAGAENILGQAQQKAEELKQKVVR